MTRLNFAKESAEMDTSLCADKSADVERAIREALQHEEEDIQEARARRLPGFIGVLKIRPWLPHATLAVVAIMFIVWPTAFLMLFILCFWAVLVPLAIYGPDRFADFCADRWYELEVSRPETAESLRGMADAVAIRLDMLLDLLPARWAEALSLPDLSQPVDARLQAGSDNTLS